MKDRSAPHGEWMNEFRDFLDVTPRGVPPKVSERVLSKIRRSLRPSAPEVIAKMAVIHLFAGASTLALCPQLGVGPIGGGAGLTHFVMAWGEGACAFFCGGVLFFLSSLFTVALLRPAELRRANAFGYLSVPVFAAVSLALLMLGGAEGSGATSAAWIGGAVLIGWFALRWGSGIRFHFFANALPGGFRYRR